MKINNAMLTASVTGLKHRIDVNTFAQLAAKTLALNEIGVSRNLQLAWWCRNKHGEPGRNVVANKRSTLEQ